jgi:hypothetical protein
MLVSKMNIENKENNVNDDILKKIEEFFLDFEISNPQKDKIINCVNKFIKENTDQNKEDSINIALRKIKKYAKKNNMDINI